MILPFELHMWWQLQGYEPGVTLRVNCQRVLTAEELHQIADVAEAIENMRENVAEPVPVE